LQVIAPGGDRANRERLHGGLAVAGREEPPQRPSTRSHTPCGCSLSPPTRRSPSPAVSARIAPAGALKRPLASSLVAGPAAAWPGKHRQITSAVDAHVASTSLRMGVSSDGKLLKRCSRYSSRRLSRIFVWSRRVSEHRVAGECLVHRPPPRTQS
jgi:hypothetical protein